MYVFGKYIEVLQGDAPRRPIQFNLEDNGDAVSLVGETVRAKAVYGDDTELFDIEATVHDAAGGIVYVYLTSDETATVAQCRMYVYLSDYPDSYKTGEPVELNIVAP